MLIAAHQRSCGGAPMRLLPTMHWTLLYNPPRTGPRLPVQGPAPLLCTAPPPSRNFKIYTFNMNEK